MKTLAGCSVVHVARAELDRVPTKASLCGSYGNKYDVITERPYREVTCKSCRSIYDAHCDEAQEALRQAGAFEEPSAEPEDKTVKVEIEISRKEAFAILAFAITHDLTQESRIVLERIAMGLAITGIDQLAN